MSRGNDGQNIYFNDAGRVLFLETNFEMSECFEIDFFAYVWIPNHYYLLVKTPRNEINSTFAPSTQCAQQSKELPNLIIWHNNLKSDSILYYYESNLDRYPISEN